MCSLESPAKTHNIHVGLNEEISKIIPQLSSNIRVAKFTATFRVAAIHVYKIGLPFKLVLA